MVHDDTRSQVSVYQVPFAFYVQMHGFTCILRLTVVNDKRSIRILCSASVTIFNEFTFAVLNCRNAVIFI